MTSNAMTELGYLEDSTTDFLPLFPQLKPIMMAGVITQEALASHQIYIHLCRHDASDGPCFDLLATPQVAQLEDIDPVVVRLRQRLVEWGRPEDVAELIHYCLLMIDNALRISDPRGPQLLALTAAVVAREMPGVYFIAGVVHGRDDAPTRRVEISLARRKGLNLH